MWQQWLNFIAGLWVVVSAYLGFSTETLMTNLTISGLIIAALGLWGALEHAKMVQRERLHVHA